MPDPTRISFRLTCPAGHEAWPVVDTGDAFLAAVAAGTARVTCHACGLVFDVPPIARQGLYEYLLEVRARPREL